MPTKPGTQPGYGPGTRPNPNVDKTCARGFKGCGQTAGTYDPLTQTQKGRKSHSVACQAAWKASGAAVLQAQRKCPRMSRVEMQELKQAAAAQQHEVAAAEPPQQQQSVASPAASPTASPTVATNNVTAAALQAKDVDAVTTADPRLTWWAETEDNQSLVGLALNLRFGALGECRGKVTGVQGDMFTVAWTCGPRHHEEFMSENISLEGVLGWHLRTHKAPPPPSTTQQDDGSIDWPEWEDYRTRGSSCPLFDAPTGAKLIDFALPVDGREFFPGVDTDPGERWWATLARLNDPRAAHMYAPDIPSFPLAWLLTIILVTKEEMGDPSVKLPTMVVPVRHTTEPPGQMRLAVWLIICTPHVVPVLHIGKTGGLRFSRPFREASLEQR